MSEWIKINYKGVELLIFCDDSVFVNKPEDVRRLGIYAGYNVKEMFDLIDKKLEEE